MTRGSGRPPAPPDGATVRIVPANEASWDGLQAVPGVADYAHHCQRQMSADRLWWPMTYALAHGATELARSAGARAIEGCPMMTERGACR